MQGAESFLERIRGELIERSYVPQRARKKEIPKEGSNKVRTVSIPCIPDRVVQGALKLIVEPIFEADFQPGSFGYRPRRSAQRAVIRVADAIAMGKTQVIDLDLKAIWTPEHKRRRSRTNARDEAQGAEQSVRAPDPSASHLVSKRLRARLDAPPARARDRSVRC